MSAEETIAVLKKKRGLVKTRISKFKTYLASLAEGFNILELQMRLEKIENLWSKFDDIQTKLDLNEENEDHDDHREVFEKIFFETIASAKALIINRTRPERNVVNAPTTSNAGALRNDNSPNIPVKLPTIRLPEFNGDYDRWLSFRDTFSSLIDENESLTGIQKFHYLRSCLKDGALQTLDSLETSEANYKVALDLLKERYERKRIIINSHVKALFELSPLAKESHSALRKLNDSMTQHIRSLKSLGQPTEHWDTLLIHLISSKLDQVSKREWEKESMKLKDIPKLVNFTQFLDNRCQLLESLTIHRGSDLKNKQAHSNSVRTHSTNERAFSHVASASIKCALCKGSHQIYVCADFLKLQIKQRFIEVKKLKLCTNCLRDKHLAKDCQSRGCRVCNGRHNTLLHFEEQRPPSSTNNPSSERIEASINEEQSHSPKDLPTHALSAHISPRESHSCVLLATANVAIFDNKNQPFVCRALLDSGSQPNFISNNLYRKLNLASFHTEISISGINCSTTGTNMRVLTSIKSIHNNYNQKLTFHVVDKITGNLPTQSFDISQLSIPPDITLADPSFHKSSEIDLLLGAEVFWNLLCVGQIRLQNHDLILQKTKLGWIISGPIIFTKNDKGQKCHLSVQDEISKQMENFWKLEECTEQPLRSKEEMDCERHFLETTLRDDKTGKFIVELPFRDKIHSLGDSLDIAVRRFHNLEKSFKRNPTLKERYTNFMTEYERLGHMSKIKYNVDDNDTTYYMPHHGVVRESSSTTKLRVVFDASAKTTTNVSLNDVLKVGPVLQDDLFSILVRFRVHKYAIIGDIEKMYRQVDVVEKHQRFQRIVWRENSDEELNHYQLCTVTYGTASASFLAIRALQQTALDFREQHPRACNTILSDFYVDDLITGVNSITEGQSLISDMDRVLRSGHFRLRKWVSSDNRILNHVIERGENLNHQISDQENVKTLGLLWNSKSDFLSYNISPQNFKKSKVTKRRVLSCLSQIFDPLGLVSPVVVIAKLVMQRMWQLGISWDEGLPADLFVLWQQFIDGIVHLIDIQVPRCVIQSHITEIQVHGFCDASEKAYGAAIYLRVTNSSGQSALNLLCSKSRVAPIKTVSLPRLELCGALLLSRLSKKTIAASKLSISGSFFWCDSTIVLAWINSEPNTLKTFVAHRVSEIQAATRVRDWRHIAGDQNPADIVSRGMDPETLARTTLWWKGPVWLEQEQSGWPVRKPDPVINLPERKSNTMISSVSVSDFDIFDRFSTFSKLRNVVGHCVRFVHNCRNGKSKLNGGLSPREMDDAVVVLVRMVQRREFGVELKALETRSRIPSSSKLIPLDPFIDDGGIIRVGGRLRNSDLPHNHKFPMVIPSNHALTRLIIEYEHLKQLHIGVQGTLAAVRKTFWPLNGKSTVRRILHHCIACFRVNPRTADYKMGDLPESRITGSRPFLVVGTDFAGPLYIRDGRLRNRKIIKAYLCVFVCFASKAVHFELVGDLTSDSFLNAFKRFVARRGLCSEVYSDNGTNFVGAERELNEVATMLREIPEDHKFSSFLSERSIKWHFAPPRSPNFGGLWEAAVKSAKYHLRRVVGNAHLTYEELYTVIVQIESVLNSRPLVPLSNDPNDLEPLTPSHFLIGETMLAVPQQCFREVLPNRLSNYQRLQQMTQHFWNRWRNEYLSQLQERYKWQQGGSIVVKPGLLVVLTDENAHPLDWKMGRITEVYPGSDGVIRVVAVKTMNGIIKRSLSKICPLPLDLEGKLSKSNREGAT